MVNGRRVKLKGEAFFEVEKVDIQFSVESNDVEIKVYGTQFNVNAYNEMFIETVLVNGSVGITIKDSDSETKLNPNQRATLCLKNRQTIIDSVDTKKIISWMKNEFRYKHDPLSKMADDLSRWFNIEIEFSDSTLSDISITAVIKRDMELDKIIDIMRSQNININKRERGYIIEK